MSLNQYSGSLTISLDFELYWGMRDKVTLENYRENLLGVWSAVPKILSLFEAYQVHATWATVGFLFLEDEQAFKKNLPDVLPCYENKKLSPYEYFENVNFSESMSEKFNKMHFANELIKKIKKVPFQEIATHTFSHYYTREPSICEKAFEADMKQAIKVGREHGVDIRSLVFPRNQIDDTLMPVVKRAGIDTYRGNPAHWAYKEGESQKTFLQRVYRFFDIYLDLSGSHLTLPHLDEHGMTEVKSSMFMRAYSKKLPFLEGMKLNRIKKAMTQAAQTGKNFHLWWHPHNFGINQKENISNLQEILEHFNSLKKQYGMVSLNMQELGKHYA